MRQFFFLLQKDLKTEFRNKDSFFAALLFSIVLVLLIAIGLLSVISQSYGLGIPVFWSVILFAGVLLVRSLFEYELTESRIIGVLLSPVSHLSVFYSKVTALFLVLCFVQIIVFPLCIFFFALEPFRNSVILPFVFLVIGNYGFCYISTLFQFLLFRGSNRPFLLPIIVYPLLFPLFISVISGMYQIILPVYDPATVKFWLQFGLIYDMCFTLVGGWIFELLLEGE